MRYASSTNIGRRAHNEDAYLVPSAGESYPLIAVADGMGGHVAGKLASLLTVEALASERRALSLADDVPDALKRAVQRVNVTVFRMAQSEESLHGMGSTLVCAWLAADHYVAVSVGDSRLYHMSEGTLRQVTCDHSLVEMLVQSGQITREEARWHPQRNIITRAIGLSLRVEIDVLDRPWKTNDILLLCSDGLHGSVTDEELCEILLAEGTPEERCETLIARALMQGACDNITAALVQNNGEVCP